MSIEGYFDSIINIWNSKDKRTKRMVDEMKAVIRQFDTSRTLDEIDKNRLKDLSEKFETIRKEVYK